MITNNLLVGQLIFNVNTLETKLAKHEGELASGNRVNQPSDDPIAAARIVRLNTLIDQNATYQQNVADGQSLLQAATTAIGQAQQLMQSASQLAIEGNNSALTQSDMSALGDQVNALLEQTLSTANGQFNGRYTFSGTSSSEPFVATRNANGQITAVTYKGDTGAVTRTYGAGQSVQVNLPGSQVFGSPQDVFTALINLRDDLASGNQAALSVDLTNVRAASGQLSSADAILGAALQRLNVSSEALKSFNVYLQSQLAESQSANLPAVTLKVAEEQAGLQGALQAGAKMLQPSLLDYIA